MRYFFRFLKNNPLYAVINVVGLALSLMFVILIGDCTYRQYSVDKWHRNHKRIEVLGTSGGLKTWETAIRAVEESFPEVESTCCMNMHLAKIKYEDRFTGDNDGNGKANVLVADSTFFNFFDFKFVDGDKSTALDGPEKCVITESLARKLFYDREPLGQPLNIVGTRYIEVNDGAGDPYDSTLVYTVSAVIKDLDKTALLNTVEVIANSDRAPQILGYRNSPYLFASGPFGGTTSFLMPNEGASLDGKIDDISKIFKDKIPAFSYFGGSSAELIPLDDLMFDARNDGLSVQKGDKSLLGVLLAVVLAILLFAVTNYINLTVANTGFRAKEVATRRLLGSDGGGIAMELIVESTLMVFVSFLAGLGLALLTQDYFAELFGGKIDILRDINPASVAVSLAFILLTGVVSGIIPVLSLLKFKPIDIVKGSFRYHSKMVLSKAFIILQNIITVTMLSATLTILLQISHLVNAPLGFNTENMFYVQSGYPEVMRDALDSQPFVRKVGTYTGTSFDGSGTQVISREDKDRNNVLLYNLVCDKDFIEMTGLELAKDFHLEGEVKYLNEVAANTLGISEDSHEIRWADGKSTIVGGVFSNFHISNVLDPYKDFIIEVAESGKIEDPGFLVQTDGSKDSYNRLRALVEEVDKISLGDDVFRVRDLEAGIRKSFSKEKSTMRLVGIFTGVALLISVLGFIGMSLFFIRQRRSEVGVRRIMGSTSDEVLTLLLGKFCAPLLVSFVFAVPLAWFLMNRWLEGFSYRIALSPWIFLAAGAASLLVAVVSVFFQILRASRTNPAEAIRTE